MRFGNRYVVKITIISVSIINSSSANVWQHSGNYNAHTRGRTDHFNINNSSNKQVLGCYLFTVSNSGLLFSHGRFVSTRNIHPWPKKEHFSSRNHELWNIILTFHLDLDEPQVKGRFEKLLFGHSHSRLTALPGLLMWSVKTLHMLCICFMMVDKPYHLSKTFLDIFIFVSSSLSASQDRLLILSVFEITQKLQYLHYLSAK